MVTKQRSPNYPGYGLGVAIEDVKKIYQKEQRSPFALEVGAKALGYGSLNGAARVRMATIRQYGLLDLQKGNQGRLSNRALTLILRNAASKEYAQALKDAALDPPLFKRIYEERASASDDSLLHDLVVTEKFTDEGARRFIKAFRGTMTVAGLGVSDIISRQEDNFSGEDEDMDSDALGSANSHGGGKETNSNYERVPLRLLGGKSSVVVQLPHSMSEKAWKQMMDMLNALKPGYVDEEEEES